MTTSIEKSKPFPSTRRLTIASVAALAGCVACCLGPILAVVGLGSGALGATLASVFQPGSELIVGGAAFAVTLGGLAVRDYRRRRATASDCGDSGSSDRRCCDGTATTRLP